jgi:hypothetical protein
MPYTNGWSNTIPAGALPANQIDSAIQQARLDLEERLCPAIFNTPFTDDPLVVNPAVSGKVTGKEYNFHWSDIALVNVDITDLTQSDNRMLISNSHTFFKPIIVRDGVTITRVKVFALCSVGVVTVNLMEQDLATGNIAAVSGPWTYNLGVYGAADSTPISILLAAGKSYSLKIATGAFASIYLYGGQILYDVPDCRNTR